MSNWTVLIFLWIAATMPLAGQGPDKRSGASPDIDAGRNLFAANCAVCHGVDGTGGASPVNLARGPLKHGGSDTELFNTISKGIPGTEMPGSFLNAAQIQQLVAFVKSLNGAVEAAAPGGNAARGETLFQGKAGCLNCHSVKEEGSHAEGARLGPNLYGIGERRTASTLESSIPRRHRGLSEFAWRVHAVTKAGRIVEGTRINEDTYSVQLRDANGNLVSLLKSNLREYKVEKAEAMPVFESGLTAEELSDLVAYLVTLRKEDARQ